MNDKMNQSEPPRPLGMESKAILKGNIVIPPPFWNGSRWVEWIPWDEI